MASGVVDICLIPEVSFCLEGKQGLMSYLSGVLEQRGHCVICMAEGAGQVELLNSTSCLLNCSTPIGSFQNQQRAFGIHQIAF